MTLLQLVVSLFGLWLGTELIMRGATAISMRYQLSGFFIGLVVLSVGSDLPEIAVAIHAGLQNRAGIESSGIVTGSSLGSALGQIGLVMGVLGLAGRVTLQRRLLLRDGTVLLGSILLLAIMGMDGRITSVEGASLVIVYMTYMVTVFFSVGTSPPRTEGRLGAATRHWIVLMAGILVVVVSSRFTVASADALAMHWGVSQTIVSIAIIGVGTSLPELSISIAALLRKKVGMSVGNLIGSNILDTLVPIGISAIISPLVFERRLLQLDLPVLFLMSAAVLCCLFTQRGIRRPEGAMLLAAYFSYIAYKLTTS